MDFYVLCDAATHLKMYPVFDVIHYTMMCINVKEDIQKSGEFSMKFQNAYLSA